MKAFTRLTSTGLRGSCIHPSRGRESDAAHRKNPEVPPMSVGAIVSVFVKNGNLKVLASLPGPSHKGKNANKGARTPCGKWLGVNPAGPL